MVSSQFFCHWANRTRRGILDRSCCASASRGVMSPSVMNVCLSFAFHMRNTVPCCSEVLRNQGHLRQGRNMNLTLVSVGRGKNMWSGDERSDVSDEQVQGSGGQVHPYRRTRGMTGNVSAGRCRWWNRGKGESGSTHQV